MSFDPHEFDETIATLQKMNAFLYEQRFEQRVGYWFGHHLRRARILPVRAVEDRLDALLSATEFARAIKSGYIVHGSLFEDPTRKIVIAVEIEREIGPNAVTLANDRASLLRRAGFSAIAAVVGETASNEAREVGTELRVAVHTNGHIEGWSWALTVLDQR